MFPKPPAAGSASDFETEFEILNIIAEAEVEAEQSCVRNAFSGALREAEKKYGHVDALSPEMIMARDKLPTSASNGFSTGILAGMMPRPQGRGTPTSQSQVLYGVVFGAIGQLAVGMGRVMAAPPEARADAFRELVKDACVAGAASGAAVWLMGKLRDWLVASAERILAVLGNAEAAEKLSFKFAQGSFGLSAACGTLLTGAWLATVALVHGTKAAWANLNHDTETADMEWAKVTDALGPENLIRTFVMAMSRAVIAFAGAELAGPGLAGTTAACVAYFASQWVLEHMIARKKLCGGWSPWLMSWFVEYRGAHVWSGGVFDKYEQRITDQLKCHISLEVVVDPVRSIRTGAVYERAKLYAWLERKGTDPLSRERTTRLDYIDAPRAREHAARIAGFLGASAVRSP